MHSTLQHLCQASARRNCSVQTPPNPMLEVTQDPGTIFRMVQKCGPQIFACVNDPDCKAALDCLQACDPTDQVPTCIDDAVLCASGLV
jgi:hypothetical protein